MKQSPRRSLLLFICTLLVVVGMIACQKADSVELDAQVDGGGNGGTVTGTANFTIQPAGTNGSNGVVYGTFEEGIPLAASSTVTVTVDVTKTGTWAYTTGQVNGFLFGGSGEFTTTGKKSIRLYAVGTPGKAGNFTFKLKIGDVSCPLVVKVAKPGQCTGLGEYYYKATIDGVNYFQDARDNNGFLAVTGGGGGNKEHVFLGMINYNGSLPSGKTAFTASKGYFQNYQSITKDQFYDYFAPGDYSYTTDYKVVNGIQIGWTDPSGVYWATEYGAANQTGSTFKIVSTEDANDLFGRLYLQCKIQFTCKLYNQAGAVKTLTNGEALVIFGVR